MPKKSSGDYQYTVKSTGNSDSIKDAKPFYSIRTTKTDKEVRTYFLIGTKGSTGKRSSLIVKEEVAKKFGTPSLRVSENKRSPRKSCKEKFDECEAKKAAKKATKKTSKKKAAKKEESEDEASGSESEPDSESGSESEPEEKPKKTVKKKPAAKAAKKAAKKSPAKKTVAKKKTAKK